MGTIIECGATVLTNSVKFQSNSIGLPEKSGLAAELVVQYWMTKTREKAVKKGEITRSDWYKYRTLPDGVA